MAQDFLTKFGDRVKKFREAKGLNLSELSNCSGLDPSSLSQVERGDRNLTLKNVANIAEGLGVEPYQLFMFPDQVSEPQNHDLDELLENAPKEKKEMMYEFAQTVLEWSSEEG